jgi:hypothetical protein
VYQEFADVDEFRRVISELEETTGDPPRAAPSEIGRHVGSEN